MKEFPPLVFTLDGTEFTLDTVEDCAIGDLDDGMMEIAGRISWYSRVLAMAIRDYDFREAELKTWKATYLQNLIDGDSKLAEWKAKNQLEAAAKYRAHKQALAESKELVNVLDGTLQALKTKAEMLRSIGAWRRIEWDATRMNTKEENKT